MKCIYSLLLLCLSQGLLAFHIDVIKDGDENFKNLNMSFEAKAAEKDGDKTMVTFKVKVNSGLQYVTFYDGVGGSQKLTPAIKDGMATITFAVENKFIKSGRVNFSYESDSNCPPTYGIELKDYLVKKEEK